MNPKRRGRSRERGGHRAVPLIGSVFALFLGVSAATAQGTLDRQIRDAAARSQTLWVSYRVPAVPRHGDWGCQHQTRISLEGPTEVIVLARIENGKVGKVRTASPDCEIDSGSLPLVALSGVTPEESVRWLTSLAKAAPDSAADSVARGALGALAMHGTPAAVPPLIDIARNDGSRKLRGEALFWLAQRAGREAVATINSAVDNDPDTEVKKKAVFALSQLPKDQGIPILIEIARSHRIPEVRRQAMFWLGQSKDPRAISFFEEVLKR